MKVNNFDRNKLCHDLNFNYTTVREWTNGTAYPRIDKIEVLANYFGILKSDLIEENNNETNTNSELDELLFSKAKELSDEDKKMIIDIINAIKREVDKEENSD